MATSDMKSLDDSAICPNSSSTMEKEPHTYTCTICCQSFAKRECLDKHALSHIGEGPILCSICKKSILRQDLKRHSLLHRAEKPHVCNVCNKAFAKKFLLNKHLMWHSQDRPYVCDVCNKSFLKKFQLNRHWQSHSRQESHVCDVCDKPFRRKCDLTKHAIMHSKRHPHVCVVCNEAFADPEKLKKHLVVHFRKVPGKGAKRVLYTTDKRGSSQMCSFCGKVFAEPVCSRLLFSHKDGIDPYACHSCLKEFVEKSSRGNGFSIFSSSYIIGSFFENPVAGEGDKINDSIKSTERVNDKQDEIGVDVSAKCKELEGFAVVKEEHDINCKNLDSIDIKDETIELNYEVTKAEDEADSRIFAKELSLPAEEISREEFNVIFIDVKEEPS